MSEMDRLLKVVNEVEHLVCEDEELLREALEALQKAVAFEEDTYDAEHWIADAQAAITKLETRLLEE